MSFMPKAFSDIITGVLQTTRQDEEDSKVLLSVKQFINYRLLKVIAYTKWRFRRQERSLKIIAKYETGTANVTNGEREVVMVGATGLDETFKNRRFKVTGADESYRILGVSAGTGTIILDNYYNGTTDTGVSFVIYKNEYGLWPDVEEVDDVWNFYRRHEIKRKGPSFIQEQINKYPDREGKVQYVTIDGRMPYGGIPMGDLLMGHDFMGAYGDCKKMRIYPHIPDEDYIMPISCIVKSEELVEDDDEPILALEDRIILHYGACADMYKTLQDNESAGIMEALFENKLKQMLADNQETDDDCRLIVEDMWRRDVSDYSTGTKDDLGKLFDIG